MSQRNSLSLLVSLALVGCTSSDGDGDRRSGPGQDPTPTEEDGSSPGTDMQPPTPTTPPQVASVDVTLTPRAGVSGVQRVNFAVPLAPGQLRDAALVRVLAKDVELPAGRRELARYRDGSIRSVQLQVETAVTAGAVLTVQLGEASTTEELALVPVASTLSPSDGTQGPNVWARLPATWLVASGLTGPQVTEAETNNTALDVWDRVCDFDRHTVTEFQQLRASRDVWLYDRGTIMYRGYARRGDLLTLESAYRETSIYRAEISGTGAGTRIGIPTAADDVKYHYTQNLAIHYLLTGDDRFREAAEAIAFRTDDLWNPHYGGGGQFWTERHAGFSLLAYVWARIVTDDKAAELDAMADDAVDAYLDVQAAYPGNWTDETSRCFAHETNCSPWMSAILADALDVYATEKGPGERADDVHRSIVQLGNMLARHGRDSTGKPFYMLGVGSAGDDVEPFDEHWGEPAYVIAMAWHHGGRTDAYLRTAVDQLLAGLRANGVSPHMRSFNWQCRSAMATPYYLK